jgi:hypothetical protein
MYLDGEDAEPLRSTGWVGWPAERDPIDGYFILAKEDGAGIITHFWAQLQNKPDSATSVKIWIDDSLIWTGGLYSLFKKRHGAIRAPLDTIQSGGLVCDIQMPFKRNFKITYYADFSLCCLFWQVIWRPVKSPDLVSSFTLDLTGLDLERQANAEKAYWHGGSPWGQTPTDTRVINASIAPGESHELTINGPGLITEMHFEPSTYDSLALRDLWLELYWDGNPRASVDVPFADFFGGGSAIREMRAHHLRTKPGGVLTSYFPMPFAVDARLRLTNKGTRPIGMLGSVRYSKEVIDRSRVGYFAAQFSESPKLRYNVYHPVGYVQGRGRFVGMHKAVPEEVTPAFLEGDPFIYIDSNIDNHQRYTGSEDYFNGGWFMDDGPFTLPFAGAPHLHRSYYRFHILDAIDFNSSFEYDLQHGVNNDFQVWYRTVAFFYLQPSPYWTSADTIRHGAAWSVAGSGYQPNEPIKVSLGGQEIFQVTANADGRFAHRLSFPSGVRTGGHILSVNGLDRAKPLWVLNAPHGVIVRDTAPAYVSWRDTLRVQGNGFTSGGKVVITVGGEEADVVSGRTVDTNGGVNARFIMPLLTEGLQTVEVSTDRGEKIQIDEPLLNTRTLYLEIEDMLPPLFADAYFRSDYMGYFGTNYSANYYLLMVGDMIGQRIIVPFTLMVSDTFRIETFFGKGFRFGDYRVTLDDLPSVIYRGFEDRDPHLPIRSDAIDLGVHYLAEGMHTISFELVGKDPRGHEYLLGADLLKLTPVTTRLPEVRAVDHRSKRSLALYPNPTDGMLRMALAPDMPDTSYDVEIVDVLGRIEESFTSVYPSGGMIAIPVHSLARGSYFLRLRNAEGAVAMPFLKD